uniref:LOB domain-containing protein n=1 Tax=Kalanchoe fedtschenkoi TaxID=63787 RepID=A0A7N0UE06_KALFE
MRTSCNGCRVLRKGCPDDCNIRPCLSWITSPEAQGNATVFLAKFYGRAGLMNFLNATSDHHRAEIFKSLLYEACGRIVDPIYGAVGLLWSNNWPHCEAAVDAVLSGRQIVPIQNPHNPSGHAIAALNSFDIRHVARPSPPEPDMAPRPAIRTKPRSARCPKHNPVRANRTELGGIGPSDGSGFSVETVEGSVANRVNPNQCRGSDDRLEMGLELSLNLGPGPSKCI